MKTWWLNLSLREKQTTTWAAIGIAGLLLSTLIFSPLSSSLESLREKIHHNQTLLAWMQESDKRIASLEKTEKTTAPQSTASLLSLVQSDLNNQAFGKSVVSLQQAENDSTQLRLQKINFDTFMKWLIDLCHRYNLIITEMTIQPSNTPGIADIDLKLSST
jgi:type II secretory pathway component PulM